MKQKIWMVWRDDKQRLPGHLLLAVQRGCKGTDDLGLGHIQEAYRAVLGKDEHLGKQGKGLSDLALTERQRAEATLGPCSRTPLLISWHLSHFRHSLPQGKIWFSVQGAALIPLFRALPACPWGPSLSLMNPFSWSCQVHSSPGD